jgi:predicted anti-sigma-YlaC factor YlaD
MKCTKICALLSAYADRELTGVEMFLVRQHLHECPTCRAEETAMRDMKHALGSMRIVEPAEDFQSRLMGAVLSKTPSPTTVSLGHDRSRFYAVSAVALAAAASVVLFGGRGSQRPTTPLSLPTISSVSPLLYGAPVRNVNMSLQRDRAFINSTDPLTGPQLAVAAYGSR